MFIDVTRYGGLRVIRLAVSAVAYLDSVEDGTSIHLLGGETLRVNEDPSEIELRCMIIEEAGSIVDVGEQVAADIATKTEITKPSGAKRGKPA
jgi:hypothetical protein